MATLPIATVNPQLYGADALVKQVMAALAPQFAQENRGLMDNLAGAGIVGGSTLGATGALDQQQLEQSMGLIAPMENTALSREADVGMFDASQLNTGNFDILGMQNQDWLAQLQLQEAMMQGQTGAYQPIFQNPSPVNFTGFGSLFQPGTGGTQQAPPPPGPSGPTLSGDPGNYG